MLIAYPIKIVRVPDDELGTHSPSHLVPSSRIRLLATAVVAPLHPALSLASRLMGPIAIQKWMKTSFWRNGTVES